MWHDTEKRPTMYVASMDIKTAFDVARPKHTAKIMVDQDVHGRIIAALLREMAGLEGQAIFENVESKFHFTRRIRQGNDEASQLWLKMALQILFIVEEEWKRHEMRLHIDTCHGGCRHVCSFMWADNSWILSHSKTRLEQIMKALIEGSGEMGLGAQTSKSMVDKYFCWREKGRYFDQDDDRNAQVAVREDWSEICGMHVDLHQSGYLQWRTSYVNRQNQQDESNHASNQVDLCLLSRGP